ncbi:MAG: hypothetical protein ABW039_09940 [Sphingobium sp.]
MLLQAYARRKVKKALAGLKAQVPPPLPPMPDVRINQDLENRIAVLEQIVTDPRHRLSEEIERLR